MDLFEGVVTPDFSTQVHDFNPGNLATGVFWTVRVPREAVRVHPEDQAVVLDLQNFAIPDFGNLPNALMGGASQPGVLSLRMEWTRDAGTAPTVVRSEEQRFVAQLLAADVTATITATTPSTGFRFTSDPMALTKGFAVFGMERNGVFFGGPDGPGGPGRPRQ